LGKLDKAIMDFSKVIDLMPDYSLAYFNRGVVYSKKGNKKRSIEDYTKAIELNPDFAQAYFNRGLDFRSEGFLREADHDFKMHEKLKMNKIH
jgi:tetratricopeptide (TPR) repeat protein